jgi:hypothetical protein
MPESCQKASEIDLAAFLTEPQNPAWEEFRQHYPQCEPCSAEVAKWEKLEHLLGRVSQEAAHPAEERLVQFKQSPGSLTPKERRSIQLHLKTCPVCREGLALLASFDFSLIDKWIEEEKSVRASAEDKAQSFSRLIIQVAHQGLKLMEQHLVSPFLEVQEVLAPMPAYRPGEGSTALHFRINTSETQINATVVQEGERVALNMTFLGAGQEALAGQRVFLRRQGRSVFSAKTDSKGVLRTPRLKPGIYEVVCPGIQTTFQLEFRS